ncbi:uncharacterized protein [Amphiura filiformis]|uniref:uncharacterized protein n=1 Tax=Amphiura filiformis TaxID=82378 RepID=UPI003B21246F
MASCRCTQNAYINILWIVLAFVTVLFTVIIDAAHLVELNELYWCPGLNYHLRCSQTGPPSAADVISHPSFLVQNSNSIIKIDYVAHFTTSGSVTQPTQGSKYTVVQGPLYETDTPVGVVPSRTYYLIVNDITRDDDGSVFTCTNINNVGANPGPGVFEENMKTTVTVYEACGAANKLMSSTSPNKVYSSQSISSVASSSSAASPSSGSVPSSTASQFTVTAARQAYKGARETNCNIAVGLLSFFLVIAIAIIAILACYFYMTRSRKGDSPTVPTPV